MRQQLGRLVRFCFGLQALSILAGIPALIVALNLLQQGTQREGAAAPFSTVLLVGVAAVCLDVIPLIAWWKLKHGGSSARRWALAASIASLPIPLRGYSEIRSWSFFTDMVNVPMPVAGTLIGIAGLIAFWTKDSAADVADPQKPKETRVTGDGTSTYKDHLAGVAGLICLWISFDLWTRWSTAQQLPQPTFVGAMVLLQIATFLSAVVHELGHYVAGRASDMVLRSFQAGPMRWSVRNGVWRFNLVWNAPFGGAVGMVPTHLSNIRSRQAFMVMGGPISSLVLGLYSCALALSAKGHSWERLWCLFSMIATISCIGFVVNLIPQKPSALYSDGAQIYQLVTNGGWAKVHLAFSMVAASLVTSIRPRDFDGLLLESAAEVAGETERALYLRLYACAHHLDCGRIADALASLDKAAQLWDQAAIKKPADACALFVFVTALCKRDLAAAELWWSRLKTQGVIDRDADYWKARAALLWLRGENGDALDAWEQGRDLALELPTSGAYQFTRSCYRVLRDTIATPASESLGIGEGDRAIDLRALEISVGHRNGHDARVEKKHAQAELGSEG